MYFLSILCVIVLTGMVEAMTTGASLWNLVDGFSVIILVASLIPLLLSAGLLKDFNNAFRLGIGKKKASGLMELKRAKEALGLAIKVLLTASLFFTVLEGNIILLETKDLESLGPTLSIMALTMVYGVGAALVLLPLEARLNLKMQEFISEKE